MLIPEYQSVMLPLLTAVADGAKHKIRKVIGKLAAEVLSTEAEGS